MKVALVAEWLDPWRGGAETSTQQFIHRLMDRGVDVHLFTRSRPSPTSGLQVHSLNGPAMTRVRQSVAFIRRVERELRSQPFDLVHAITPCRSADVYQPRGGLVAETIERNIAMRASRPAKGLKRVATRLNLRQQYLLGLERRILRDPNGPMVVAISGYVARQLVEHYAVPPVRIREVFNGVDPDSTPRQDRQRHRVAIRREYGLPENVLVALSVAHNFRLKGVHRWMQALAMLRARGVKDVRALVIGRGESPAWHRLARRLRIENVLVFVGATDRVAEFYHAADLLVHPTYYDPCSRVVLEAMTRGLPCITTRWDGAGEIVEDGRSGFVLDDPDDVPQLARRVELLRDSQRRDSMAEAARLAAANVSMGRHAEELMRLYDDLLHDSAEVARRRENLGL